MIVKCDNCNELIEYERYEIMFTFDGFPFIECPCCGEMIEVQF